jgi:hypothetical protein
VRIMGFLYIIYVLDHIIIGCIINSLAKEILFSIFIL